MIYLNETLDASEAHNCGLITKVIADKDFDGELMRSCTRISTFSSQVKLVTNVRMIRSLRIETCT